MALLVADSGPIIALARLQLLWLPARLERELLVTGSVWTEVTRAPARGELPMLQAALSSGWLTVLPDTGLTDARLAAVQLDEGELAALSLALQRGAAVLIDELRGRTVAAQLGLDVVGTLGLLLIARERGLVGSLRPLVELLKGSGYFLAHRLVSHVLANEGG